jgi:Holliday junction resolvase RusA-like endonuclease
MERQTMGTGTADFVYVMDDLTAFRAQPPPTKREPDVLVWLPGPPKGKGAPRAMVGKYGRMAGKAMIYPDPTTRNYEQQLKAAAEKAMAGRLPFDCALRCRVTAVFPIPVSMPKKDQALAREGFIRPTTKPDDDNLLKCRDALKGVAFRDDALFVESVVRKFYGDRPGYQIEIWMWQGTML